jgi:dihydroxy-acid dehydratase
MTKARFDKSKLPSRHVTEGPARAPHRSYFYAMGISEDEIHQPWVGVATCWNEAAPCNIALNRQAQAVKQGVKVGGGTPREFTTITVTDGIAMGHEGMRSSLASREAIADTVELTMRGHCYDALVGLAGCDKSLPGMMMAMVRLNVPSGVHLWRLDPAGAAERAGCDGAGRVRGRGQASGRELFRCRAGDP